VTSLPRRLWRAALLDADLYEEIEADRGSIGQALLVVGASAAVVGVVRWVRCVELALPTEQIVFQVVLSVLEPLVLWFAGSALAYMVGASFFRGPETESDFLEVLRTTGFAFTPALLRCLALLRPAPLGLALDLVIRLWVLVALVVALRQALDFTTVRAAGTFGLTAILLWLLLWGLTAAPFPGA
jgi:hypothetical protein